MAIRDIFEITLFLALELVFCDDFPRNVVVMAGSDKVLPCAGGLPFRWYIYPPTNPSEDKVIFMGEEMAYNSDPQYRVYLKPNNFPYNRLDLLISDIRPDHSGTYKCQKSGSVHCAELIVLGSDPKCTKYETTADKVQLKCDVNVTVNGVPEMNCFHNINKESTHAHCKRKRASETAVCKAKVPASAQDDYTCVIGIKHQPRLTYLSCIQAADNPSYRFIWPTSTSPISRYSSENSIAKLSPAIAVGLASTLVIIVSAMSLAVLCVKLRRQCKLSPLDSDLKCTDSMDSENGNLQLESPKPLLMSPEHQHLVSSLIKNFEWSFHLGYTFLFCKKRPFCQRKLTNIKSASIESVA